MISFKLIGCGALRGDASGIRVGFEDSVLYAPGKIAETNVVLVEKMVSLVNRIGYEVASPNAAREILGLPYL